MGKIVEMADTEEIFENPQHPYTRLLLELSHSIGGKKRKSGYKLNLEEKKPSKGCKFYYSCPEAEQKCSRIEPRLLDTGKKHFVACWNFRKI
ncbi:MAG TPA: hypothetical protein EYP30_08645 [Archaeoglobaceae archaeon]|nr:hypothetical protein [Archaeoglobaceae archaeon]